ncbi:MAG: hypothetical protein Q9213_001389 [Squamulea squamosa]
MTPQEPHERGEQDLKEAIRLSLANTQPNEQPTKTSTKQEVIVLNSDASTTDNESSDVDIIPSNKKEVPEQATSGPMLSMLGLDRKAMEEERLARKRKASISPPPNRKTSKLSGREVDKRTNSAIPTHVGASANSVPWTPFGKLPYVNGAVKKTWALGHPRDNDIKLEEVLQKEDLTLAVLSSFQWDVEWILGKIDMKTTQLVFIMQAETDEIQAQYRNETTAMPNLRLCFPSMEGQINCMHSKLMLLSYPTHLRVVVPTANLVPYDWGETGVMENSVFLIDLPRLPIDGTTATAQQMTGFGKDLVYFLQAIGLEQSIINSVHHFDLSTTKGLAFVHTIGGAHSGDDDSWRRTGYCGLGRAISRLGLASQDPLNIDYITSSVGSLTTEFLTTLYLAAQGDEGLTEYNWRTTPASRKSKLVDRNMKAAQQLAQKHMGEGFRIYFPSSETVRASTGGPNNGGTICFQSKWWYSPTFPRHLLRDCKSQRKGMLMHNKILYVYPTSHPRAESHKSESKSWVYIGSANCSESAWGRLVKDRQTKEPKLNCRNWECGVVVPFRRAVVVAGGGWNDNSMGDNTKDRPGRGTGMVQGLEAFEKLIPVPMEYPGKEYGDRKPWFYLE